MTQEKNTKFLCLALEAPFQSYGTQGKVGYKSTHNVPTRSAILGMISNAARIYEQDEVSFLKRFFEMEHVCFTYSNRNIMSDFQMIHQDEDPRGDEKVTEKGYYRHVNTIKKSSFFSSIKSEEDEEKNGEKSSDNYSNGILLRKEYIQDGKFIFILETPSDLVDVIEDALHYPKQPIYLGRKCCIPTKQILVGFFDTREEAEQAGHEVYKDASGKNIKPTSIVEHTSVDAMVDNIFCMNEIPISFGEKRAYGAMTSYERNLI